MAKPRAIVFGQPRPSLGSAPEDVLRTGIVPGLNESQPTTVGDLYEQHSKSGHVPSYADQRLELDRARTLESLLARRLKDQARTRQHLAGAALAEALTNLDITDPKFEVNYAKAITQFPEGVESPIGKTLAELTKSRYEAHQKALADHRNASYKATMNQRIEPLLGNDLIPFDLKNQLVDADGNFNANAIEKAEAMHATHGGKNGADFYSKLLKEHGLTKSDLEFVIANPNQVSYRGPQYDEANNETGFGKVSAETVEGKENKYRAVGVLPDGGALNLPLHTFNALVTTHKNLVRQAPAATAPAAVASATRQAYLDREVQESSARFNEVPLITAPPPGYAEFEASKTGAKPAGSSAADEIARLLGGASKSPAPAPTPAAAPTPTPTPTPTPVVEDEKENE